MILYLFFDFLLSTCPKKKMETEKCPKAADSPLHIALHTEGPIKLFSKLNILTRYNEILQTE